MLSCVVRVLCASVFVLTGCTGIVDSAANLPPLSIEAVGPTPLVPNTRVVVKGTGFVAQSIAQHWVTLEGTLHGVPFAVDLPAVRLDEHHLAFDITGGISGLMVRDGGTFDGVLAVHRMVLAGGDQETVAIGYSTTTAMFLVPQATGLVPQEFYPGDTLQITGSNFLQPNEGVVLIQLDGVFQTELPVEKKVIAGLVVPVKAPDALSRHVLSFVLTPDILGIRPGAFSGSISVINQLDGGLPIASPSLTVGPVSLRRPYIDSVSPEEASRGQKIVVKGRGFLPTDGLFQSATLLLFEGTFKPTRGAHEQWTAVDAVALYPEYFDGNTELTCVLRADKTVEGKLEGLSMNPGHFKGHVTPVVLSGADMIGGDPFPLEFQILAALQVVEIRLLPAFDEALDAFGLLAEKEVIKNRILEVVTRDYTGINVSFTFDPPDGFEEYAVVEVGAYDPNGGNLFGLDNTSGKDVGNLRFDDVVGGFNADTRAANSAAYGGVFVAEFLNLSPTLSNSPLASYRFDEIFGSFSPALGGLSADSGEMAAGSARAALIHQATRVLGNLIGNTISHEVGHTLGLAAIDGQFHNVGDNPGAIMDGGSYRPFAERAEIDGQGPASFSSFNREYLQVILPTDL